MENTVIGVYDSYTQAQSAMNEIVAAGVSRSNVRLNPESESPEMRSQSADASEDRGSAIGNFFRSLFGMDDNNADSDIYAEAVRRGSCVLTVDADNDQERDTIMAIMNRYDPVDIEERSAQWRSQGWSGYDATAPWLSEDEIREDRGRYVQTQGSDISDIGTRDRDLTANQQEIARDQQARQTSVQQTSGETSRIPVVEEQLKVGKREVQRGGVRVVQRMSETPVHESVDLRQEKVKVERHPVDQPASEADLAAFKEGSVEMRETSEEPVVEKVARVVEEVVVGKEVTQQRKDIDETVRRTDVDVEQLGADSRSSAGKQTAASQTAAAQTGIGQTDMSRTTGMNETGTTGTTGTMGSLADDDTDYRRHWQSAYGQSGGRYEDYDAAYRYGSTAAGSDRFKNYRWEEVEPQMRSDWESQHPESTWDKVKDAVRYGADRVKSSVRH